MFSFYNREGFKLFPCNLDKTPRVSSWRSESAHLSPDEAERITDTGGFVGAWLPPHCVVIDLDRNHHDKAGEPKADGLNTWSNLMRKLGIEDDLTKDTLVVKTGSGGMHLYFKLPEGVEYRSLSQKSIAESVDVRTHLGYVIAAGTNGYTVQNHAEVLDLPSALLKVIQTRNKDRAKPFHPTKELSIERFRKVLRKIDASDFNTNDLWQEFVTSCIAVAGNSDAVMDLIEDWSKTDSNYAEDSTIRKRIETFEPDGGITAGTFLYILKKQQISKYLIDKVRMEVGAQFTFSESFTEANEPPFEIDFSKVHDHKEHMKAFYYTRHQTAGVNLFVALCADKLTYASQEKAFYFFNGNRWVELAGIANMIFPVLLHAGQRYYTDVSREKDSDADEIITEYISYIGSLTVVMKFEQMIRQHPDIVHGNIFWDSPDLQGTLTIEDSVLDFSGPTISFRQGNKEEFRRLFIDLKEADFKDPGKPAAFKQFLADVFPNSETRKTATYALSTMLSGTGKFRKFQIWNGAGSNGKSTLMETMRKVIGNRAISYKADVLLSKQHLESLTPELAVFRGALAAFSSETEDSKRISQAAVKTLTGNETMTANPKYQKMIEFKTTFQVVLSTNFLPNFSAHDDAFVKRILILPFQTCFFHAEGEKDRAKRRGVKHFTPAKDMSDFESDISGERPAILLYLAKRYRELGDEIPESSECLNAKKHYIEDNNDIVNFINEFVEFDESPGNTKYWFTPTRDLTDFYNDENNTRYSSKFVVMRVKEVYPMVEPFSKVINNKLTRGIKHIRLKANAYPEGYTGNFAEQQGGF